MIAHQAVLSNRFPGIPLVSDIRELTSLPKADLVTAGLPLPRSQPGWQNSGNWWKAVRSGRRSFPPSSSVITALAPSSRMSPFMLQLDQGNAMRFLTTELEELGFTWAYRIIDAQGFGLPQRRHRVLLVTSRTGGSSEGAIRR